MKICLNGSFNDYIGYGAMDAVGCLDARPKFLQVGGEIFFLRGIEIMLRLSELDDG